MPDFAVSGPAKECYGVHGGLLETWTLRRVLREYLPGTGPWDWHTEFRLIAHDHVSPGRHILVARLHRMGIQEPILLGRDGRVWDGHYRLWWATHTFVECVPVEVLPWDDGRVHDGC